jgi:hypothetical protein
MRASPWTLGWLLLVSAGTVEVAAQEPSPPSRICYRGRPLSHCSAFWITEANYHRQLVGTDYERSFPIPGGEPFIERGDALGTHLSWELGGMVNRGAHTAVGATVQLGASDVGIRGGLTGRYRRWLGPATTGAFGDRRNGGPLRDRRAGNRRAQRTSVR